jgi:hypothetical protein
MRHTAAERQRKHREGNAAVLRHSAALLRQALERLETLDQRAARLDHELMVAAAERRQGNATLEQMLKRMAAIEQTRAAQPDDRRPPKFARTGLEKV